MAVQCNFKGCQAQVPDGAAPLHALDHLAETVQDMVQHHLQEPLERLDERLQALDQHIQGLAPVHGTLEQMIDSAETCPECHRLAVELTKALLATTKPASQPTAAKAPPPPQPLTFDPNHIDWLGLEAFGLRPVETDEGVVIAVDDDSSLDEAVEAGLLPQGCTAQVGPDGETKYVCPR